MSSINYFQYRCYSNHPFLKSLGDALFERFTQTRKRKLGEADRKKYRRAFIVAISGLVQGGAFNHLGNPVHIALNKNHYFGESRLNPIFGPELFHVLKWLIGDGYLEQVENEKRMFDGSWVPRGYRLTKKYLDLAVQHPPDLSEANLISSIGRNGLANRVELRINNRSVRLRPSAEKDRTLIRLAAYDKRLQRHRFEIGDRVLGPYPFSLTRIYTNDYTHGGRYYSTFQRQPSSIRLSLSIDGEPTVEVDYKGLHPALLYQRVGLEAPEDPYSLPGYNYPRSMVKKAFQVLVNRSKPAPAASALVFYLNERRRQGRPDPEDWGDRFDSINLELCERLESTLFEHFSPISHFFCSGVGLELQHYDSQLVSHVLDYFLAKTESIVIPIHDSFLVKQSDLAHLAEALRYAEVVQSRASGFIIRSPYLEAEVMNPSKSYDSNLSDLGTSQSTRIESPSTGSLNSPEISAFSHEFYDQYNEDIEG